jgi:hypothetical protein
MVDVRSGRRLIDHRNIDSPAQQVGTTGARAGTPGVDAGGILIGSRPPCAGVTVPRAATSAAAYRQVTSGFQSANMPAGFGCHTQACMM